MAKSILPKPALPSNQEYISMTYFISQIDFLAETFPIVINKIKSNPGVKNSPIFKNLVKISQEFVKICATQEGV